MMVNKFANPIVNVTMITTAQVDFMLVKTANGFGIDVFFLKETKAMVRNM